MQVKHEIQKDRTKKKTDGEGSDEKKTDKGREGQYQNGGKRESVDELQAAVKVEKSDESNSD